MQTAVNGLVLTNATATGVVTTYGYDALGRQVTASSVSDNGARTVGQTLHYNGLGQVDWTEDGATNRTAFAYDAAGRQSAVTNALGQVTTTLYDALGNVTNVTGATYPVSYGYDAWNRMVWMKTYRDENGAGDLTQWQHDLATGLVTNKVYANGKGTSYTYTPDGKLARRTWARGVTTDYGYTIAGELETVGYSDSTPDVTYTHDHLGRPVTVTDALGVSTNVYDAATLALAEERWPGGVVLVRTTDAFGRPSGISLGQDYAVTYGYDTAGRFGSVTANVNSTTNVVTYGYVQGSDLLAGWSSNVGMSFHRTFEQNRDLISTVTNAWNGAAVSSFAYTNDEIGRRTARVDSGLTQNSFGYNMRSELVNAIMGTNNYGYEFDPIGNRIASTNNTATLSYTANELNQYLEIANGQTIEPSYDDDGNMTAYGDWTLVWNGENRLTQISNFQFQVYYTYDYQGRMIEKTVNAATTRYLWDDFNIIAELGANKTRYNIWGLDLSQTPQGAGGVGGLLAVSVAGGDDPGMFYPAFDANGNITAYVDATGDIVASRTYSPFGETTAATGNANAFTHWWSTKPWDPVTGFSEYEFRMYYPGLGRWVNRDPIEEEGGVNLYGIINNHMVSGADYLGLIFRGPWPDIPGGWRRQIPRFELPNILPSEPRTMCARAPDVHWRCGPCKPGDVMGRKQRESYVNYSNGCGPFADISGIPGWWIPDNPSRLRGCSFTPACDAHDCCFGYCGTTQQQCDDQFLENMYAICDRCTTRSLARGYCRMWARIYSSAVRGSRGAVAHNDAQEKACEPCCCPTERTPQY